MSIKVGNYHFTRLKQLGIDTVFGVPGDYELALLDLIGESGVEFCGNANELIASYAADGYGRLKGAGSFVTTFGPGELSAYCGHAGAYTEHVPVCHVVGYPGRPAIANHTLMHHTLGTGQFDMYHEMAKHISADAVVLMDPKTGPRDVDRALTTMMHESRPIYVGVPVGMSHLECDATNLKTPILTTLPVNDAAEEKKVVAEMRNRLEQKKNPIIIVDGNATRGGVQTAPRAIGSNGSQTLALYISGNAYAYNQSATVLYSGSIGFVTRVNASFASIQRTGQNGTLTEVACADTNDCNTDQLAYRSILARGLADLRALVQPGRTFNCAGTGIDPLRNISASSLCPPAWNSNDRIDFLLQTSAKGAAAQCSGGDNGKICGSDWRAEGLGQDLGALNIFLANLPQGEIASRRSNSTGSPTPDSTAVNDTDTTSGAAGNTSSDQPVSNTNDAIGMPASSFASMAGLGFILAFCL